MTLEDIRKSGAKAGLFTLTDIAKSCDIPQVQNVYRALKKPDSFPETYSKLVKFYNLYKGKK